MFRKKCYLCQKTRLIKFFNKRTTSKDGYRNGCRICEKKNCKNYYLNNKKKINKWKSENKQTIKEYQKEYHKTYREKNKEKIQQYKQNYQIKNRQKINLYLKNRYHTDLSYKIKHNIRTRINLAIKNNSKYSSTTHLIGCSIDKLKNHLEQQFTCGMTWNNYGQWHIDHINPCCNFDLSKIEEQKKCFHYSNLQPLWASDNLSKGGKIFLNA